MKTFKELFHEILNSDELKKAYEEAVKADSVEAFLKEHGCEATSEDIKTFFKEQGVAEMTEKELSAVAGGTLEDPSFCHSAFLPWQCDPNYSSIIKEDGSIDFGRLCA